MDSFPISWYRQRKIHFQCVYPLQSTIISHLKPIKCYRNQKQHNQSPYSCCYYTHTLSLNTLLRLRTDLYLYSINLHFTWRNKRYALLLYLYWLYTVKHSPAWSWFPLKSPSSSWNSPHPSSTWNAVLIEKLSMVMFNVIHRLIVNV